MWGLYLSHANGFGKCINCLVPRIARVSFDMSPHALGSCSLLYPQNKIATPIDKRFVGFGYPLPLGEETRSSSVSEESDWQSNRTSRSNSERRWPTAQLEVTPKFLIKERWQGEKHVCLACRQIVPRKEYQR